MQVLLMALQMLISGLLLGGMYALIASGFSIVNGVMKLFNFSHGAFVMLGAYVTFWSTVKLGINPILSIPISMILMFAIGYIVQKYIINLIVKAPTYMTLILTFGLNMLLVNIALVLWTGDVRSTPMPLAGMRLNLYGASIPVIRLIAFIISILVTIILNLMMGKTSFGRSINAARMDLDAAKLVGVNISNTYALTFGIGTALAGCAGSLIAMVGAISPSMASLYSIKAFAICILGGSGSMMGPLVGGIIIGLLETFGVAVLGAGYQEAVSFSVLLILLIFRPKGIFGKELY